MNASFVREGRANGMGDLASGNTGLMNREQHDEHDPAAEFIGERRLAAAVFAQAFMDLGVRIGGTHARPSDKRLGEEAERARKTAKLFLFDAEWRRMRVHWLSLLGLTDEEFQELLARKEHQGQKNRVLEVLMRNGSKIRFVTGKDVDGPYRGLEHDFISYDEDDRVPDDAAELETA